MQIAKSALLAFVFAISSAFFIANNLAIEEVEASGKTCGIGDYYDIDAKTCKAYQANVLSSTKNKVEKDLGGNIVKIVNGVVSILLLFAVINIIYSALQLMMKGVNPQIAEEAKKRLFLTFIAVVMLISLFSIFRIVQFLVIG